MNNGTKLRAKLFSTQFSTGHNVLAGWSAEALGGGRYRVTRANGTTRDMAIGEPIEGHGPVSVDDMNNLRVGDYSILIGKNIQHGWLAKPGRKEVFRFKSPEGSDYGPFSIGEEVDIPGLGKGVLSTDELGSPVIEGKTIPLLTKQGELNIVVFNEKVKSGYLAYFNVLRPGDKGNRKNGIRGVFYPSPGGSQPAAFCEVVDGDDYSYRTAVFWPTKKDIYVNAQTRSLDDAIREREIYKSIDDLRKIADESRDDNEVVEAVSEEIKALEQQLEVANGQWKSDLFTITMGQSLLFGRRNSPPSSAPQMADSPAP